MSTAPTPAPSSQPATAKTRAEYLHTVTPHLICADAAAAIDFYRAAFGATEEMRLAGKEGKLMHACVRIGDSAVMLMDEYPDWGALGPKARQGTSVTIHLNVDDADAVFARAVEAGAKPLMPVAEMFWGDRYGVLQDPFGHHWSVATHVRDVSPDELRAAAAQGCGA